MKNTEVISVSIPTMWKDRTYPMRLSSTLYIIAHAHTHTHNVYYSNTKYLRIF